MVIGLMFFRIYYSGLYLLVPDETNYWQWGRHLAWGYHDNSPLIGWTIRLSTELFGQNERAVRLPSVLAVGIASAYMLLMAKRWFGARAAFHTSIMTQGILALNVGGLLATTDGLQAAGWAGAAFHVAKAYEKDNWAEWLLGGFWFGFGMLAKLTMVVFLPGAYLFGLFLSEYRDRLFRIKPYAGLLLGFFMFTPVIIWNAENGWNSVRHVAHLGGASAGFELHAKYLGDYLGSQAGLLSPIVFILILYAWYYAVRNVRKNPIYLYMFLCSFIMFAGFALLSLHKRVYANWPGACYLTSFVLCAALYSGKESDDNVPLFYRKTWPWAVGTSYLLTAILLLHVAVPILPLSKKMDRVAREVSGWKMIGQKVDEMVKQMPNPEKTFIFGKRYQLASALAFYTPGQPDTVSINRWSRPNVYDYWCKDEDYIGMDAIGVTSHPDDHEARLNKVFNRVEPPVEVKVYRDPFFSKKKEPARTFYIYRAYGFKGGMRWVPPDASDIRAGT
jgi:undecaprenyl-diphosphatase